MSHILKKLDLSTDLDALYKNLISVDSDISLSSSNPVCNRTIAKAFMEADFTAIEVFPTDKMITAGMTDSNDRSDENSVAKLFDFDNSTATNLPYNYDIQPQMVCKFDLFGTANLSASDVIIDFGDGHVIYLNQDSSEAEDLTDENDIRFRITHQYGKAGKYVIKIYGKRYRCIRFDVDSVQSILGEVTSPYNIVSRILDSDLDFCSNIDGIASLIPGALRILKIDNGFGHRLKAKCINFAGAFNTCKNLLYAYGLKNIFNSAFPADVSNMFRFCRSLTDTDFILPRTVMTQGFNRCFEYCTSLTTDISCVLPRQNFMPGTYQIGQLFNSCSSMTGIPPADKLWNNPYVKWENDKHIPQTIGVLSSVFSTCGDELRSYAPISWGGTNSELSTGFNVSNAITILPDLSNQIRSLSDATLSLALSVDVISGSADSLSSDLSDLSSKVTGIEDSLLYTDAEKVDGVLCSSVFIAAETGKITAWKLGSIDSLFIKRQQGSRKYNVYAAIQSSVGITFFNSEDAITSDTPEKYFIGCMKTSDFNDQIASGKVIVINNIYHLRGAEIEVPEETKSICIGSYNDKNTAAKYFEHYALHVPYGYISVQELENQIHELQKSNVLYEKSYLALGDSFTNMDGVTSYANRIAERNSMRLTNAGIDSGTMPIKYNDDGTIDRPTIRFAYNYEQLSDAFASADYITFAYGINDSGIFQGTRDSTDLSTQWGAWNAVLSAAIKWNPTAKVGIIINDAPQLNTNNEKNFLLSVAEWWGLPALNLIDDRQISPMLINRQDNSVNPYVIDQKRNAMLGKTIHPNDKGQEFRSTVIEDWLRRI